jgi:hypothetical protein
MQRQQRGGGDAVPWIELPMVITLIPILASSLLSALSADREKTSKIQSRPRHDAEVRIRERPHFV